MLWTVTYIFFFSNLLSITATKNACPVGWVNGNDLGCLYFGSVSTSWLEALAYCEEINSNR